MKRFFFALLLLAASLAPAPAQTTPTSIPLTYPGALAWSSSVKYPVGAVVTSAGSTYLSLVSGNTNHTPASSPTQWAVIGGTGVTGFNSRTGSVTLTAADVNAVGAITNPVTLTAAEVNAVGDVTNNTSGNAATATALAGTPTQCSAGQAPTGIDASGNAAACTATGGGTPVVNDRTFSASYGTVYQNTTAHPLKFFLTNTTGGGPAAGTVTMVYGATSSPATNGPSCSAVAVSSGAVSCFDYFEIPPSDYYKVSTSGTTGIASWIEITTP